MKQFKLSLMMSAIIFCFHLSAIAQQNLPEIVVRAVRYKYLSAVDHKDLAQPVKILERRAAAYDIKSTDYYEEDYDTYFVSFYLPEGTILASYDKNGKLLSTAEKYNDISLPIAVRTAILDRFTNWTVTKDVYRVDYHEARNVNKVYKVLLENGDKRMRVNIDEAGNFK